MQIWEQIRSDSRHEIYTEQILDVAGREFSSWNMMHVVQLREKRSVIDMSCT